MAKSTVYFTNELTPEAVVKMYRQLGIELPGRVAVKVHSGEDGNQNYLHPEFMKPVIDAVNGTVVECNTAYGGARNETPKHIELMKKHHWSDLFDVDIMDAEGPDVEWPVENGKVLKVNYLGKNIENYDSMLEEAKSAGVLNEQKMYASACMAAKYMRMAQNGELSKEGYWKFMREQHELFYGPHYNEDFAMYDVAGITYLSKSGDRRTGAHWTKDDIESATKGMSFPSGTTIWDKYVAFNAFYSDMCQLFEDDMILKAAYKFFFQDEDAAQGKIWKYMQAVKKI